MKETHLTIHVQADPGTLIDDAFSEAVDLANRVRVDIEFKFNGVTCIAKVDGSAETGVKEFHEAMQSKMQYKFAFAR